MRNRKIYEVIANKLQAIQNCKQSNNVEWKDKHTEDLKNIIKSGPSGSGIDCGTKLDFEKSNSEKLVFDVAFHHMDEHGYYDGWTNHKITVRPSLLYGFTLTISGRDKNFIKEYLLDTYQTWLDEENC